MKKKKVTLFFRKLRSTGNFSIESSFGRMVQCFPVDSAYVLHTFFSSYFSNGVVSRIKGILEARKNIGDINHVTGDVHYMVLGLPADTTILTIHDCGLLAHQNVFIRRILKLLWLDLPVRHCRYVTAVSEATKSDIIKYTNCSPDKVVVIPTIVPDNFKFVDKKFNVSCPRILHIGLAENKNFGRHVQALAGMVCHLHIIGKLENEHIDFLMKHNISYSYEYNINQDEIQRAYAECDILLFASTLEGFGMPIIEAQIVGRVVVTSNISSMPEVASDAACLVDPYDVSSIRSGIEKIIKDEAYRTSLIKKGVNNVSRFDAKNVSLQYEKLYERMSDRL